MRIGSKLIGGVAGLLMTSAAGMLAQTGEPTVDKLILRLKLDVYARKSIMSCGSVAEEGARMSQTVRKLAAFGYSAIPSLERVLESVEGEGKKSEYAEIVGPVAFAYAKILGPAAAPRLRDLIKKGEVFPVSAVAGAIGYADGLTGYQWPTLPPASDICEGSGPLYSLGRLIFAWQAHNSEFVEEALGPKALRSWLMQRAEFWDDQPAEPQATGFVLLVDGRWSEPYAWLRDDPPSVAGSLEGTRDPVIETVFSDKDGNTCGRVRVEFTQVRITRPYQVNNGNLREVLEILRRCSLGIK